MFQMRQHLISALTACILLGGCTDNGFLFRSFGGYSSDSKATYKIGEAYQIKGKWYTPEEDYSYHEKGVASWYQEENGKLTANGEKYDENIMSASHKTLPLPSMVRVTNLENGNVAIVRVNDRGPFVNNRLIDVSQKAAEQLEFNMTGTTLVKVEILPDESKRLKQEILKRNGGQMEEENTSGASVLSADVTMEELSNQPIYQPDESMTEIYNPVTENQVRDDYFGIPKSMHQPQETFEQQAQLKQEKMVKMTEVTAQEKNISTSHVIPLKQPVAGHYIQVGAFANPDNANRVKDELLDISHSQIYIVEKDGSKLHRVRIGPFETREDAAELLDKLSDKGYGDSKIIFEP